MGATGYQFKDIHFSGDLYQDGTIFSGGGGGGVVGTNGQFTYNDDGVAAGSDKFVYLSNGPVDPGGGPTGPAGPTIELGAYLVPSTDATYDLGATGIQFKDVFFSGNLYQNGTVFSGGGGGGGAPGGTSGMIQYNDGNNGFAGADGIFIDVPGGNTSKLQSAASAASNSIDFNDSTVMTITGGSGITLTDGGVTNEDGILINFGSVILLSNVDNTILLNDTNGITLTAIDDNSNENTIILKDANIADGISITSSNGISLADGGYNSIIVGDGGLTTIDGSNGITMTSYADTNIIIASVYSGANSNYISLNKQGGFGGNFMSLNTSGSSTGIELITNAGSIELNTLLTGGAIDGTIELHTSSLQLEIGTNPTIGDVLTCVGANGDCQWQPPSGGGGGGSPGGTSGMIQYNNGSGGFAGAAGIFIDGTGSIIQSALSGASNSINFTNANAMAITGSNGITLTSYDQNTIKLESRYYGNASNNASNYISLNEQINSAGNYILLKTLGPTTGIKLDTEGGDIVLNTANLQLEIGTTAAPGNILTCTNAGFGICEWQAPAGAGTDGQFTYNSNGTAAGLDKFLYLPTGPTGPLGLPTGPQGPTIEINAEFIPKTDATYDLGATGIQFKDVHFSGNLYQNGTVFSGGGGGGAAGTTGQFTYNNGGIAAGSDKFVYFPSGLPGPTGPAGPTIQLGAHIVPDEDNVYDLGATGLRFRDLHVGGSTIYLGNTVSLSAASDGTVTLGNANGNVSLLSAQGAATTLYGMGITDTAAGSNSNVGSNSNATLYDWYGSNTFSFTFAEAPVVIISMYAVNLNTLPLIGTTIVATNITTTGFQVYSDEQNTGYFWTASLQNNSA